MNIKQFIKKTIIAVYKRLTPIVPLKKNMILFQSNNGVNYTGNPRYIYEEMIRQGLDQEYDCVWILLDTSIEVPGKCRKIRRNYPEFFWNLMRAKFWVFDSRQEKMYVKKKDTVYIQTWHGTPLKNWRWIWIRWIWQGIRTLRGIMKISALHAGTGIISCHKINSQRRFLNPVLILPASRF